MTLHQNDRTDTCMNPNLIRMPPNLAFKRDFPVWNEFSSGSRERKLVIIWTNRSNTWTGFLSARFASGKQTHSPRKATENSPTQSSVECLNLFAGMRMAGNRTKQTNRHTRQTLAYPLHHRWVPLLHLAERFILVYLSEPYDLMLSGLVRESLHNTAWIHRPNCQRIHAQNGPLAADRSLRS